MIRIRRQCKWVSFVTLLFAFSTLASSEYYRLDDFTKLNFDELRGQWVVISYWAIWCPPCRDEIKILNAIHQDRHKHNVTVLGVNFDGVQGVKLREQKRKFGIQYPDLLKDPAGNWDLSKPGFIPRTLIIDKRGKLAKVFDGVTTRKEILQGIQES